jgi:NAD(P)-dependent dehydrogenase (short-subunit alcohol dehydrogenase family)
MSEFRNKVVWITGASSGIGEAVAYEVSKNMPAAIILSAPIQNLKELETVPDVRKRESFAMSYLSTSLTAKRLSRPLKKLVCYSKTLILFFTMGGSANVQWLRKLPLRLIKGCLILISGVPWNFPNISFPG